jgi:glucokinase
LQELIIGVDLGATKILTGIMDIDGNILDQTWIKTGRKLGSQYVLGQLTDGIKKIIKDNCSPDDVILGIVVASPGPLAWPEGIVYDSPNLKWSMVPIKRELETRLKVPFIAVEHDTNIAALGEYYFGYRQQYQDLIYITVSTGIGGGYILNGQVYRGARGGAGELGHMVVKPGGERCGCGRQGCLEAIASGTAISREANLLIQQGKGLGILAFSQGKEPVSAREVAAACLAGDPEARNIIDQAVKHLGLGIANLVNLFNPEIIILGGSVALGLKDYIAEPLENQVKQQVFRMHADSLQISFSSIGQENALLGCLARYLIGPSTFPRVKADHFI